MSGGEPNLLDLELPPLWRCDCGAIAVYFVLGARLDPLPVCYRTGRNIERDPTKPPGIKIVPITIKRGNQRW